MTENNPLKNLSFKSYSFACRWFWLGFNLSSTRHLGSLAGTIFRCDFTFLIRRKNLFNFHRTLFSTRLLPLPKTTADMGVHDHGSIVWDEFVGVFIVLAAIPSLSWQWILAAFALFRFLIF